MKPALFLILFLIGSLALPSAGVTISQRPDTIANGQPMFVTIRELRENASFSLLVQAECAVQPDSEFRFQMSQFVMPFALKGSSITATLSGTSQNRLEVMKESTMVAVSGKSRDGHFSTTKTYDITPGTYDYFRLVGTSLPTAGSITAQLQVTGTKQGPADSEISFVVEGLPAGTITLAVLVDGTQALYRNIPVGGTGPSSAASVAPPFSTRTPAPEGWSTFTSADGMVSITVSKAGQIGFLKVPAGTAPEEMRVLSGPYTLVPLGEQYLPPGQIRFLVPEGFPATGLVIGSFTNGTWSALPSTTGETAVSARVTTSGTYALLGPNPTRTATTAVAATTTAPSLAETTATTPASVPTTRTGLEPAMLLLAMGAGFALAAKRGG